ncbi:MAG: FAD-dependent oxidoreductase [Planctomycetota bacterium]
MAEAGGTSEAGDAYDFVVVGSGFGGSVAALRLTQKGYRVLLLEKGRRLREEDFPRSNWNLRRWMWIPWLGFRGLFKMTFLRHVTVLSGVGVGGGSLVYANTLPVPKDEFFTSGAWAGLADWRSELEPHYGEARRMLGAAPNPYLGFADQQLAEIGEELGRGEHFRPADVAVYFGTPGETVEDPYFDGEGPPRTGCIQCGGCMLGCQHGSKNTLDKNYLYLAEKRGLDLRADTEVTAVRALEGGGYRVEARVGTGVLGTGALRRRTAFAARRVVFAGGVLGTVDLLARMKADPRGLPRLSDRVGDLVRTNSESLIGVIAGQRDVDHSKGIAISSILHTDEHSHVEPVRYPSGSGFFRTLMIPHVPGDTAITRLLGLARYVVRHPLRVLKAVTVPDLSRSTTVLLYMRSLEGTLSFRRGRGLLTGMRRGLRSRLTDAEPPTASIPEATDIARRFAERTDGQPMSLATETLAGIPTTAHILGGACIGASPAEGVIDAQHRVFGHEGLWVVDGAAISANPGVNPSLSITAMAERAMSFVPPAEGSAGASAPG